MEEENQNPREVVDESTEETVEETSDYNPDEDEDESEPNKESKEEEAANDKMINLKAVKACNLGKIERNGQMIYFIEGEEKEVKYDEAHKRVVDMYVEGGFLEIVKE